MQFIHELEQERHDMQAKYDSLKSLCACDRFDTLDDLEQKALKYQKYSLGLYIASLDVRIKLKQPRGQTM